MYRARRLRCDAADPESGTMLPVFGGLVFVAFAVIALTVELALLGGTYRAVAGAADAAAESGASMLARESAYSGSLQIDVPLAVTTAESVARSLGSTTADISVHTTDTDICVSIADQYRTRTLGFIGVATVPIGVTSCASPRSG